LVENGEITIKRSGNLSAIILRLSLKLIVLFQQILHFDAFKLNPEVNLL